MNWKAAYPVAAPEARADRVLAWRAPLHESLPRLADMGYAGVELMIRDAGSFEVEATRELAGRYGLSFAAVGTGPIAAERGLTLTDPDDATRREAIDAAAAAIGLAAGLGCCVTIGGFRGRGGTGDGGGGGEDLERVKARFAASLAELLPIAEQHDVTLCIEPQNRFQSAFYRTVAEIQPLLEQFPSRALALSLDSFHMNIEESDFLTPLQAAAPRLGYVQVADNHRGPPGTGLLDFARFRHALAAVGYRGWICLEVNQPADARAQARAALAGLRRTLLEGAEA